MEKLSGVLSTRSNQMETLGRLREELVSAWGGPCAGWSDVCCSLDLLVEHELDGWHVEALLMALTVPNFETSGIFLCFTG